MGQLLDQPLPHHKNIEESILATCILGDGKEVVQTGLQPDHFYIEVNQIIYQAIIELIGEHKPTDLINIVEVIKEWDQLERVGGASAISRFTNVPVSSSIKYHTGKIKDAADKRVKIIEALTVIQENLPENNQSNQSNQSNCYVQKSPEVTGSNPKVTGSNRIPLINGGRFNGNLRGAIRAFIKEYQGSFTTQDIDREFGLTHPADKNARKQALKKLDLDKYIKKDTRILGKYHILKSEVSFINIDATDASPFHIELPLDLANMIRIPKKSLIVMAGTTNSGKTALAIDVLRKNLSQDYPLMYLMSEMGPSEYKQRILNSVDDIALWKKKVMAADVPGGFDTVIAQHNPNGLTVVDFLEEIQGEYYRIASDLRSIYDGLDEGVAVVCLQKHSKAEVGRGGEATAEKPRLYLNIDKLIHERKSTISAVKVYKAKDYIGDNPNGLERHIVFTRKGSEIRPISDWMYCNETQRRKWTEHYEQKILRSEAIYEDEDKTGFSFYFTTKSGASVRIIQRDIERWRKQFSNINVDSELIRLGDQSKNKPFLDDKSYFFQISGILKKKDSQKHV